MLDRDTFIRPIAHRGLHNAKKGIVENTLPAFAAAISKNYGIECDLRPSAGGLPVVFHDETLQRLTTSKGRVADLDAAALKRVKHKVGGAGIATFAEMLTAVDGAVPLLVEIKSELELPERAFLSQIAKLASAYRGPIALMSFDPAVMLAIKDLAPKVPRGIVSGTYAGTGWWNRKISKARAANLRDLLEAGPVDPHFYAYQVSALPTPVTRFVREVLELPLFTWTVRTAKERTSAQNWADAEIFEGSEP